MSVDCHPDEATARADCQTMTRRHVDQTPIRHHWTWKAAFVFEMIPQLQHHDGYKLFLEGFNHTHTQHPLYLTLNFNPNLILTYFFLDHDDKGIASN
jgi:hypothetical protein